MEKTGMVRVSVTLPPGDVALLDRMAAVQHTNRSAELRDLMDAARPTLEAVVSAFEGAISQQTLMDEAIRSATERDFKELAPELEHLQKTFLGVMARIEGAHAAADEGAKS